MSADVVTTLNTFITEVQLLRAELPPMPQVDAPPSDVHEFLLNVRRRLDRVEHLYSSAIRIRGRAHEAATAAGHEAQDDWDNAILRIRAAPVRRNDEYSSAKERSAEANLATMTTQRSHRAALALARTCDTAVDVLRLLHRGLDGVRQDALAILRHVQFESHLER